jgi:hypothetical protein
MDLMLFRPTIRENRCDSGYSMRNVWMDWTGEELLGCMVLIYSVSRIVLSGIDLGILHLDRDAVLSRGIWEYALLQVVSCMFNPGQIDPYANSLVF